MQIDCIVSRRWIIAQHVLEKMFSILLDENIDDPFEFDTENRALREQF